MIRDSKVERLQPHIDGLIKTNSVNTCIGPMVVYLGRVLSLGVPLVKIARICKNVCQYWNACVISQARLATIILLMKQPLHNTKAVKILGLSSAFCTFAGRPASRLNNIGGLLCAHCGFQQKNGSQRFNL